MSQNECEHSLSQVCVSLQEQGMKAPSDVSQQWGSYFVDSQGSGGGGEESQKLTWCCHCIHKYSTMAIPSVEHIAGMWLQTHPRHVGWRKRAYNTVQIIIPVIIIINFNKVMQSPIHLQKGRQKMCLRAQNENTAIWIQLYDMLTTTKGHLVGDSRINLNMDMDLVKHIFSWKIRNQVVALPVLSNGFH